MQDEDKKSIGIEQRGVQRDRIKHSVFLDKSKISDCLIKSGRAVLGDAFDVRSVNEYSDNLLKEDVPTGFEISFVMYNYFSLRLICQKNIFSTSIDAGSHLIPLKTYIEADKCTEEDYKKYWEDIDRQVRLRIPDKYLESQDWKHQW